MTGRLRVAVVDAEGVEALTLARVAAELDVRTPSLYNHVAGLPALRRAVRLRALELLRLECRTPPLVVLATPPCMAWHMPTAGLQRATPGLCAMTVPTTEIDDAAIRQLGTKIVATIVAALSGYGLREHEAIHAARALRSAVHGFVMLEAAGGFGLATDVDESFHWMLQLLTDGLDHRGQVVTVSADVLCVAAGVQGRLRSGAVTLDTELSTDLRDVPSPTRRRVLARRALRVAWFAILCIGLALALQSRWAEVRHELATLRPSQLWLSMAAAVVGVGASSGIWHQMLAGIGERLPLRVSLRIFFVGQIGKYLPGAVWPAVTQAALAREHDVAPRATVAAVTLFLWVHLITGTAVAVLVLGVAGRLPAVTLLALPVLTALLTPAVLGWGLQKLLRLARRRPLRQLPDGRHLVNGCGWALAMWACYGVHLNLLTGAVDDPVHVILSAGVFAAGWVIGFVLLIAPAGVGPREAAIVALLPLTAGSGLVVALVSRLIMTIADATWAAITAFDLPSRVRASASEPAGGDPSVSARVGGADAEPEPASSRAVEPDST